MPAPIKIEVIVESPVRGLVPDPAAFGFIASELTITNPWGLQPATAIVKWVTQGVQPMITPMSAITIKCGGHTFFGITSKATPLISSAGHELTQEFLDSRALLQYDDVFGVFNRRHDSVINGQVVFGYKSLLPVNHELENWTYHSTPYTARQILDFLFEAPTIESPWNRDYVSYLNVPIFDVDCYNGKKLGTAVMEVSQRCGATFALNSTGRYDLVWCVKGLGSLPTIPADADDRRSGVALSENPSRVRVLGGRNLYHTLNVNMEPDWRGAWEQFFDIDEFWYDLFLHEFTEAAFGDIPAGTYYNAIPGDTDFVIGKQLASARARTITVDQYAYLRDARSDDGDLFRDYRKFQGRSRMQFPAALYITEILFRAFTFASNFRLRNGRGKYIPQTSLTITDDSLVEVTHNPTTGVMSYDFVVASASAGYAIIQGYKIGTDSYKTLHPDQVDVSKWVSAQDTWQHVVYQVDGSGENDRSQFIVFDEPVFRVADLFVFPVIAGVTQDYPMFNLDSTFSIPPVKAALCLLAERFSYYKGMATANGIPSDENSVRDETENAPALAGQYVADASGTFPVELVFADGDTATQKADQLASSLLNGQYLYALGGYRLPRIAPTPLTPMIDRVTVRVGGGSFSEEVDFTSERSQNIGPHGLQVQPPRDFERIAELAPLLPGQQGLREESNRIKNDAAFLRRNRDLRKFVLDSFYNYYGFDDGVDSVFVVGGTGVIAPGTPLFREQGNLRAVMPNSATPALINPEFIGSTIFQGENVSTNFPARYTKTGSGGVILVRVKGPAAIGDTVGYPGTSGDYLAAGADTPVGSIQEAIAGTTTKICKVKITGAGGGSSANWNYRGLWTASPTTPYMTFDVVQFGSGTASGMYLSTIDTNLNSPDTGIGWTQVSSSSGTWL